MRKTIAFAFIASLAIAPSAFAESAAAGVCAKPMNGTEVVQGKCKYYISRNEGDQENRQQANKDARNAAKAAARN